MSDVLEIPGHCDSEFDDSDNVMQALKENAKKRKGRGINSNCNSNSTLQNIGAFDRLCYHQEDSKHILCRPQRSVEGWVIFVTGLHEESTEEDIRQAFSDYGCMTNLSLNMDRRTGFVKGYALIEFPSYTEALQAIEQLEGSDLLGHTIRVNWCFTKEANVIRNSKKFPKWDRALTRK